MRSRRRKRAAGRRVAALPTVRPNGADGGAARARLLETLPPLGHRAELTEQPNCICRTPACVVGAVSQSSADRANDATLVALQTIPAQSIPPPQEDRAGTDVRCELPLPVEELLPSCMKQFSRTRGACDQMTKKARGRCIGGTAKKDSPPSNRDHGCARAAQSDAAA